MPRARITLPSGEKVEVNAAQKEIQRIAALKDHRVELLPDLRAPLGSDFFYRDLRAPIAKA